MSTPNMTGTERRRSLLLAGVALLAACGGSGGTDPGPPPPTGVSLAPRNGDQQGPTGEPLPVPYVLRVTSAGAPAVGARVRWSVPAGGGTLRDTTTVTDANGDVRGTHVLGAPGAQRVDVEVLDAAGTAVVASTSFRSVARDTLPLEPVAEIAGPPYIHDTFVRDGFAFVCAWSTGLIIYDVGNGAYGGAPSRPVEVSRIAIPSIVTNGPVNVHNAWWYWSAGGEKRYVFVGEERAGTVGSTSSGGLYVVDVSNLRAPVLAASFRTPPAENSGAHNFWVDEAAGVLYAAFYNGGVYAFDVRGTLSGDLAGRVLAVRTFGAGSTYTWGVMQAGQRLYVADMLTGLWQLDLAGAATPLRVAGGGNNVPERYTSDLWIAGNGYAYTGTWGSLPRGGAGGLRGNMVKVWQVDGGSGAVTLVDSVAAPGATNVGDIEVSDDGQLLMFPTEVGAGAATTYWYRLTDPRRPALRAQVLLNGVHTATFARIRGRQYAFLVQNPPSPSVQIYDVTALGR